MKTESKILLLLFFLSPALGELLSGSAPPLEFFSPFGFLVIVTFYGCGTLLIREVKVRWNLQWSVMFLAIAYGVLEEGIMMQSFFNMNHQDLGVLAGYGMYFGIMWPWTLALLIYHATISTLIPITIIDLLYPKYKQIPLLQKKGVLLILITLLVVTIFVMQIIWIQQSNYNIPYEPSIVLMLGSSIIIGILIFLAYLFQSFKIIKEQGKLFSPKIFAITGFLLLPLNVFIPYILAENQVPGIATIFFQIILILCFILFGYSQMLHQKITVVHRTGFIFGSLLFLIVLTPIHELANQIPGMIITGITTLILLILWRNKIIKTGLKKDSNLQVSV